MPSRVEFLKSVYKPEDLPPVLENRKEIVFVGRSNVGKSSLLNFLTGKNVARVSKTPGRTRAINYFKWDFENFKVYLVDLPGYGFAVGNRKEVENWRELIETYFNLRRENIALVLLLVDAKVGPTRWDELTVEWLRYLKIPFAVVLTKTDKAKQKELGQTLKRLKRLGITKVVKTSTKEGRGKEEVLRAITSALGG